MEMVTFPDEGWRFFVMAILRRGYLTAEEMKGMDELKVTLYKELDSLPKNNPELAAGRAAELLHYSMEIDDLRRTFGNVTVN